MSFTSFFGKIGHIFTNPKIAADVQIGATVLSAFNPGLGAVVETIANAVYSVESSVGASTSGSSKKSAAESIIDVAAPSIISVLSGIAGKTVDASTAAPAIDKMIDDCVTLFNELGIFAHSATPAPAATPAPTPAAS